MSSSGGSRHSAEGRHPSSSSSSGGGGGGGAAATAVAGTDSPPAPASYLQRRQSSSAINNTAFAPTHSASPKLQAARERLQQPTELQLDPNSHLGPSASSASSSSSHQPQHQPASTSAHTAAKSPAHHHKDSSTGNSSTGRHHHHHHHHHHNRSSRQSQSLRHHLPPSASARHHHHFQSSSSHSSHPNDSHSLQSRTRIITVPVWARNEPPSPFTSPTVGPVTHTLPSLTDLPPLEPALLEADENAPAAASSSSPPAKIDSQPFQSLHSTVSAPPFKQANHVLQRFSTRSSTSSNPSKAHHRSYRKKWLFSRTRTPLGLVPSSPALRPASHSRSSTHRHDSDSDDEDDPDAVGPERFWSFTLPPRYRAKIKDLNAFRMSSFKASTVRRTHGTSGARDPNHADGADDDEDDGEEDAEAEEEEEDQQDAGEQSRTRGHASDPHSASKGKEKDGNGETAKDRIMSEPPHSAKERPTSPSYRRAPKRHNSSPPSEAQIQHPPLGARSQSQAHASTLQAKRQRAPSFNKSGEPRSRSSSHSAAESESSDVVRARRTSGDGTGAVGLPRGAAAAELDASALMSWMRRRDSSRSGPGQGGGGTTGARNSPVTPRSPMDASWHSPALNRTSTMSSTTAAAAAAAAEQPSFTLPRLAEPAHYLEPRQKQHELRLRAANQRQPLQSTGGPQPYSEKQGAAGEESYSSGADANATANGNWDAGLRSATIGSELLEFSRHQPRTPGWSTPWRPETPTTNFPFGAGGDGFGFGFGNGADPHEHGGLDLEKLGALLGRHSGGGGLDGGGRGRSAMGAGGKGGDDNYHDYFQRFRTFLLLNPFAPFFFRMINLTFTTATLAVAIKIHERLRAIGDASLVGSSPILGIIFAPLTLAHVFSQIYMEYFGRPIGLWSVRSKLFYTLIELVFVCFWSAELALSFDNLSTSPLECCCGASRLFNEDDLDLINRNQDKVGYICRLQSTLAGLSFVSLLAYLIVLAVSLFRIFERVSRTPH
ncbi:hypothetical protein OC846_001825 [Tilletia horrida]|uniref:Uncharacterized protein n=1 Tax=Tilletia horrida TaxID=155126 RepID=A0AAN6GS51_9BASI|nr:hypothetical protein OC846_001825 [Tilletia horrida]KAK0568414.1 hypothetical protein OC861_001971 [Tilletia horrida]